ncbi:hypothetical protein LTR24_010558 [Lithohypha guttulata]|uniref:Uncharacterized protein n=1 Tax=Lithohypha guttulata TaxID=1690604 RepID=A0ABR0JTY2_9EURO|nr:hypothetical protein LTR24_010558 [Lithohypha guttulata]
MLERHTGLVVEPDDVRLVPLPDDPYEWKYPAEKGHLFRRPLQKHTTAACQELICDVGRSFWAVGRGDADTPVPSIEDAWLQLLEGLLQPTRHHGWGRPSARDQSASLEDALVNKEREVQQLKSTLQHRNMQEQGRSKMLAWYESKHELTDVGLQGLRHGLVALLQQCDLLITQRHGRARP